AVAASVRASVLTIAIALPVTVLAALGRQVVLAYLEGGATAIALLEVSVPAGVRLWRLDGLVLAVVGVLLLPVAAGRWRLSGFEGIGLLLLYAGYLVATTIVAR
ncbi:MAG: hypothetical protein AAGK78_04310, partial [Planctomycetota bacterium]